MDSQTSRHFSSVSTSGITARFNDIREWFCATCHPKAQWTLRPLEPADGKLLTFQGVLEPGGDRDPCSHRGADLSDSQKKTLEEAKLKDLKAKNYLFQAIDRSTLETILKKDTAKDIWDSLKLKYQGTAH